MKRRPTALVTGGAGLIGSHIVDRALAGGWEVRILDNLQRQTHRHGKPSWVPEAADFVADLRRVLDSLGLVSRQCVSDGEKGAG